MKRRLQVSYFIYALSSSCERPRSPRTLREAGVGQQAERRRARRRRDGRLVAWPSGIGPSLMRCRTSRGALVIALRCFLVHAYAGTPGAQRRRAPPLALLVAISFSHSGGGGGDDHGGGSRRHHARFSAFHAGDAPSRLQRCSIAARSAPRRRLWHLDHFVDAPASGAGRDGRASAARGVVGAPGARAHPHSPARCRADDVALRLGSRGGSSRRRRPARRLERRRLGGARWAWTPSRGSSASHVQPHIGMKMSRRRRSRRFACGLVRQRCGTPAVDRGGRRRRRDRRQSAAASGDASAEQELAGERDARRRLGHRLRIRRSRRLRRRAPRHAQQALSTARQLGRRPLRVVTSARLAALQSERCMISTRVGCAKTRERR